MTRDELRALAQQIVADRLQRQEAAPSPSPAAVVAVAAPVHISHEIYVTLVNTGDACVIEPGVPCTHCNYCKSHGH